MKGGMPPKEGMPMKGEGMQDGGMDEPDEANAPPDARDEKGDG